MRVVTMTVLLLLFLSSAGRAGSDPAVQRASVSSSGNQGDGRSWLVKLSGTGRYVAFESAAATLVAGDSNGFCDVFVHDRRFRTTVRISLSAAGQEGNGDSRRPTLTPDGRFVVFESAATNLVPGDLNGFIDVFVHDRDPDGNGIFDEGNGTLVRVSLRSNGNQGNGDAAFSSPSDDGRHIVFGSQARNLVNGDTNGQSDIFVHDRDPDANGV